MMNLLHHGNEQITSAPIPEIRLESVSKNFESGTPVLRDLSLTVQRGQFVTLLGPSGCGKSTLLRIVAGLLAPSSGQVFLNGILPLDARDLVSFIFQDATLLPWRTVAQNVGLGLELERVARPLRAERVASMLRLVGLEDFAGKYPRQLSGGMKMRVSIARALINRPRIVLMDEPFSALDEINRDRLNEEILRFHQEQNWTVLFVTHSVAEAVFLSTQIVILAAHPGRIAHIHSVDLPWPREVGLRYSPQFDAEVAQVSRLLRDATTQSSRSAERSPR